MMVRLMVRLMVHLMVRLVVHLMGFGGKTTTDGNTTN